jgi:hypothetical protein
MQKSLMSGAIWLVSGLTKRQALTPGHLPLLSKEPAVIRTCRQLAIIPRCASCVCCCWDWTGV